MSERVLYDGREVLCFRLRNANGMEAVITNFGARIVALRVPDREGRLRDVVQGFDRIGDYFPENHRSDFGAVIGRYANRIAGGRFTLDGKEYQLPCNNGPNCLHGGPNGWQYAVYDYSEEADNELLLSLVSFSGDNGFPHSVRFWVRYTLLADNALRIDYKAVADGATPFNVTNHSYFNLNGTDRTSATRSAEEAPLCTSALNHLLTVDADRYTPTDETAIPLAGHLPVSGTPMDFRQPKAVGAEIGEDYAQLRVGSGYDHNFVLNTAGRPDRPCARLESPTSGIAMLVFTDQPGLQLYTGNFLDGVVGKEGVAYPRRSAVCLETQHYPDSPNRQWPESPGILQRGSVFRSTTIFKFQTVDAI